MPTAPLAPTLAAHLFAPLGRDLVRLLRSLPASAWAGPTVCRAWSVQDIAAHLLDTALRRLSFVRDGQAPPAPAAPIHGYPELVDHLNALNADWVRAAGRLSPRLLTDLLEWVEPQLAEHLASLDPWGPAPFAVSWAGEQSSPGWFDVARELSERWLHQQQIRLAVGAPPLTGREQSEAIFDTLLRALPHAYAQVDATAGTAAVVTIRGEREYAYTLERADGRWLLLKGAVAAPAATLGLDEQTAWLLLSKGASPVEARAKASLGGDAALLAPFFATVSVMA